MGWLKDFWDSIRGLFGGGDDAPAPPPTPVPTGALVTIRVREEGGGNVSVKGAKVEFVVSGGKQKAFTTDSDGRIKVSGVTPGPRHLYVSKSGFKDFDKHFEVEEPETTFTVAIDRKGSSPGPGPGPGPTPPLTSDKVESIKRVAKAYMSEYENAHVGRVPNTPQPKQEAFVRRAAACLHYGAPTLGIKGDGKTMLLGQRGGNIISQDAVLYDGKYYDFIISAGTQGRDLNRITWHPGGSAGNAKPILPDRNLVPKAEGGRDIPEGIVKRQGHAFADRNGPFIPVGASFFCATWLYQNDRARFDANARWLADRKVNFARILVELEGRSWETRTQNPHAAGHEALLAAVVDRFFDFGIRTQITIFGGTGISRTAAQREAVVDQVARVVNGREPQILYVEAGNESWQTFDYGRFPDELRTLAARFHSREPNILLALTAPQNAGQATTLYSGSVATVGTVHIERASGGGIKIEDVAGLRGFPALRSSGEPRGPGASAGGDVSDPTTLVNDFKATIHAGIGAFVIHAKAGIWFGANGSPNNLFDHSTMDAIVRGIVKARDQFPGDQANR